ncbi:glycosyltransferase family 4 protein [Roseivirga sp. BDSF3-8]|uniref:glycosyltransferase family 4 protein n=1 Tax=Roseivirga sp. BDSF3-8 TaxID=3241598 RepID=UPI003531F31A
MPIRILFVDMHRPNRSPSQRFRYEQYITHLENNGFQCDHSYLISANDDKVLYSPGSYVGKMRIFLKSYIKRLRDVMRASSYDIVFIQREAFMTGSTRFEKGFADSKAKVVFDFDDAIWLQNVSEGNKALGFLKNAGKTSNIIGMADLVLAGNRYLANYAANFNDNIAIVPTTIDTNEYEPDHTRREDAQVCIGWSGSVSTIQHFQHAIPALRRVKDRLGEGVTFKVMGDGSYVNQELGVQGIPWRPDTELQELNSFDIGIMPLPDDEWAKGKCGLKGLQYMALEIATIMSPVGVNREIIQDGFNGFLADGEDEWVTKMVMLAEDMTLRKSMGTRARQTVEEKYSTESQKSVYVKLLRELAES